MVSRLETFQMDKEPWRLILTRDRLLEQNRGGGQMECCVRKDIGVSKSTSGEGYGIKQEDLSRKKSYPKIKKSLISPQYL